MKPIMLVTFLAMPTLAYGAMLGPTGVLRTASLSEDDQTADAENAGKKLETLGQVLQGKVSADSAEGQLEVAKALEALAAAESDLDKESSEYWVGVVVKGVIGGVVGHGIDRWNRKNKG